MRARREPFVGDVLIVDKPMFTYGIPIAIDEFHKSVMGSMPPLPQNVYVEIQDARTKARRRNWCTLRVDDAYHSGLVLEKNGVDNHQVVSVIPGTSAMCHLCFAVKASRKEFVYIDEMRNGHDTIAVLDVRDIGLVKDVLAACGITGKKPKKFVVTKLPISEETFEDKSVTCVALMCNLASRDIISPDVRVNFLQLDRVIDDTFLRHKHPFAILQNFDMRRFMPAENLTSNFPVITCVCFEYMVVLENASRLGRDIDIPKPQFDQLVRIIAQRIQNYASVNFYLLQFKPYPAISSLLKAFDDQWMMGENNNNNNNVIHQLL